MEKKILKATHEGIMVMGDIKIGCAYLQDGTRVLSQKGVFEAIGRSSLQGATKSGSRHMPPFLAAKNLIPFIDMDLQAAVEPIIYSPVSGGRAKGFKALILPKICDVYLKARDEQVLKPNQEEIAKSCETLLRAFSVLGFYVLHDEATGFIKDKKSYEYRELFKAVIRSEAAPWEQIFIEEFFDIFYKVYYYPKTGSDNTHPLFFSGLIRKFVYKPLAKSNGLILELLDEKNPRVENKKGQKIRKYTLHQFLRAIGREALSQHIWQFIGIGKISGNPKELTQNCEEAFSQNPKQTELPFDDEITF